MKKLYLTAFGSLCAVAPLHAADASVTVVGGSFAKSCYEAAEAKSGRFSLDSCNAALATEALPPNDRVATYVNRGILKLRRGDTDGAIQDFNAAIARDPNQAEAYLNKGIALMRKEGGADEALSLISVALEKNTRRPAVAYLARGFAYEDLGNVKLAYLDYRRASETDPDWQEPRNELARFQVKGR